MKQAIINTVKENEWQKSLDIIQTAGNIIRNGGTVIFPTETVYGLGANALDPRAAQRIYKAKGRPTDNPLIVHISDEAMLEDIASDISDEARLLIKAYWPGPLTLIFYKKDIVPSATTGGLETVAVRMPSNKIAQKLIEEAGVPVAAPSANISGRPSITSGKYAVEEMASRVDMIILSENSQIGIESTVVDMTTHLPIVLRPGKISQSQILRTIAKDERDYAAKMAELEELIHSRSSNQAMPRSPGMKYRHYSPNAELILMSRDKLISLTKDFLQETAKGYIIEEKQKKEWQKLLGEPIDISPSRVKVLTTDDALVHYKGLGVSLGQNGEEIGKNLFKTLRDLDEQGVLLIFCEDFEELEQSEFLTAVMNRIRKAADNVE